MNLDVRSVMALGVLLSLLTVMLFLQVARGFPPEHRRHMRIWTVALLLQPMAWLALSLRGQGPDWLTVGLGSLLMMGSYAEMTRAIRGFQGLAEWRRGLWALVVVAMGLGLAVSDQWPYSSARVVVGSAAGVVLMGVMTWSLRGAFRNEAGHAGRATAMFAFVGVAVVAWRALDHALAPRAGGAPLAPGASDLVVFLYLNTGMIFLSLGFALMHAERAYAALQKVASVDALTGVLSRGAMEELGQRLVSEARRLSRPMSALLLDLDQFKPVNDRLGHEAGDRMLRHLAERAHRVLRGEDLLCRLGGDEFVVLLPNTDAEGARIVADRLRGSLAEARLVFKGQELPIPLSIGVADTGAGEVDLENLIKRADEAMYIAKRAGGDRIQLA